MLHSSQWKTSPDYSDVSSGKAPANLGSVCGSVQDPYTTFSYLHSRWYAPTGQPVPGPVATRFRNADFDALIDKMAGLSADDPSFSHLADQALAIFNRELAGFAAGASSPADPFQ